MVAIGVEEQVRRLEDEDTAITEGQSTREIQAGHEIMGAIDPAVSVDVFEDRDAVGPFGPARWRLGHAIVGCPRVTIDRHSLQTRRVGILQVLDDPEPAQVIKFDRHRLPDQRLASDELSFQSRSNRHPPRGFFRSIALARRPLGCQKRRAQARKQRHCVQIRLVRFIDPHSLQNSKRSAISA